MRPPIVQAALIAAAMLAALPANAQACANLPHADHPKTTISNGSVEAVLFLPDAANGYYRNARFDWGGVIGCLSYKGHNFFGEWFPRYDPALNDAITGPVEEFRAPTSEIGYDAAAPDGGHFLKIGVGVLARSGDRPYTFGGKYPIVDTGTRTVKIRKRSVTFTQILRTSLGYAYKYEKTVELDRHGAVLSLKHKLKNLGAKPLETDVYDHDFFMLDGKPTGPGMVVTLGFPPTPDKPFPSVASIAGDRIVFNQIPSRGNAAQGYLTGYTGKPGEYAIKVEDTTTHLAVEQTSASPIAKFYFWSTPKTICPEAYIHIDVPPGKTQSWRIDYKFSAN